MRIALALIAIGLATTPAAAQVGNIDLSALDRAVDRGTLLYHYDQAAWHGTDVLKLQARDKLASVGGWIIDGPPQHPEIVFFDHDEADPHAVFIADLKDDVVASTHLATVGDTLSPARKRMIAARRAAGKAMAAANISPCTNAPFNTIVVPPDSARDPITVYFLSAQTDWQTIPFGGHYAVEVDRNGVASTPRPFTKSCLNRAPEPGKGPAEAMVVTHLLDPVPTEIHVFSMYAARKPIYVQTGANLWLVDAPKGRALIRLVKRDPDKPNG